MALLAACEVEELPPLVIIEFLDRAAALLSSNLPGGLTPATLRGHAAAACLLLERICDDGLPCKADAGDENDGCSAEWRQPPAAPGGPDATINEVFVDVEESMDATLDAAGRLLSGCVTGAVTCAVACGPGRRAAVTLALGRRAASLLEGVRLHPCVDGARFDADRALSFRAPGGARQLMAYRVVDRPAAAASGGGGAAACAAAAAAAALLLRPAPLPLPLYVRPSASFSGPRGRLDVAVGPRVDLGRPCEGVTLRIKLPRCCCADDGADPAAAVRVSHGSAAFEGGGGDGGCGWLGGRRCPVLVWTLGALPCGPGGAAGVATLAASLRLDRARGRRPQHPDAGASAKPGDETAEPAPPPPPQQPPQPQQQPTPQAGGAAAAAGGAAAALPSPPPAAPAPGGPGPEWDEAVVVQLSFRAPGVAVSGFALDVASAALVAGATRGGQSAAAAAPLRVGVRYATRSGRVLIRV